MTNENISKQLSPFRSNWGGQVCKIMFSLCENRVAREVRLSGSARKITRLSIKIDLQSDLVYPNSLVPIKMCSDCETCGLLNHCK